MRFLVLFLLFELVLSANFVHWQGDYEKALRVAQKEQKPIMVLFVKSDCQKCKTLVADLFTNKPYVEDINRHFIPIIITKDTKTNYPREMYFTNTYPRLFFMTNHEIPIVDSLKDDITEKDLKRILDFILKKE